MDLLVKFHRWWTHWLLTPSALSFWFTQWYSSSSSPFCSSFTLCSSVNPKQHRRSWSVTKAWRGVTTPSRLTGTMETLHALRLEIASKSSAEILPDRQATTPKWPGSSIYTLWGTSRSSISTGRASKSRLLTKNLSAKRRVRATLKCSDASIRWRSQSSCSTTKLMKMAFNMTLPLKTRCWLKQVVSKSFKIILRTMTTRIISKKEINRRINKRQSRYQPRKWKCLGWSKARLEWWISQSVTNSTPSSTSDQVKTNMPLYPTEYQTPISSWEHTQSN